MGLTIFTASKAFVDDVYREKGATHLVSIGEPHSDPPTIYDADNPRHLRLEFDDVTHPSGSAVLAGYAPPSRWDVLRLVEWASATLGQNSTVVVHCAAGISRSTACAAALHMVFYGSSEGDAVAYVAKRTHHRGIAQPNALILQLAKEIIETEQPSWA